jgi:hypothetical protein
VALSFVRVIIFTKIVIRIWFGSRFMIKNIADCRLCSFSFMSCAKAKEHGSADQQHTLRASIGINIKKQRTSSHFLTQCDSVMDS